MDSDTSAPGTTTVGAYLAARLRQLGVSHLFGLPGDFNLTLLDLMLADGSLTWVGTANELNAAYAADGDARVRRGVAAVVTTLGVGELSAINGIAGAFAEDVPVVQITGTASTAALDGSALLHHTLADGRSDHFEAMYREVTAAAATLRTADAGVTIDRILTEALRTSKPVYLAVPTDVATAPIDAAPLAAPLERPASDAAGLAQFEQALAQALAGARAVTVLAGPKLHRRHLEPQLRRIADVPGVRVASQSGSKAIIDEAHPHSLGTYVGAFTPNEATRVAVDDAAPLVLAGTVLSDLLTGGFSHRFDAAGAIELSLRSARIGRAHYDDIDLSDSLAALARVVSGLGLPDESYDHPRPPRPAAGDGGDLTHAQLWPALEAWIPEDTLVIAEAGTAFYGALELDLPRGCDLLGQPIWSSIGFTLPATLGAGLGRPDQRAVLLIGDGSAQLTIQELGTILARGLAPVIVVINNGGYTVERAIQSPDAVYQDIAAWDWGAVCAALGPETPVEVCRASTIAELDEALATATVATDRAVLIEAVVPRDDTPRLLAQIAQGLAAANRSGD
ncbi:alpha-keto acid decarboxylase family protein [Demequina sp. NBRC 110056]|uniref:alpha-keto acid decarboxylase family protein n=1 Tax=Demequina sp. NBRC 110056 TaxID=1570345 RepID=UPI0009FC8B13|nr:thiamine pyrophosphate-binding protein [Demequina sp. NBRC 110056]